ncbi:MAG: 1-acyl-sn-glycerol-3-phosphate acyltransferase [Lachnospiraceae bacterium]|nr:1-acyl-sn-glycerol-3-phosphate acyltransferase [Lachnospiraceae bacterium]
MFRYYLMIACNLLPFANKIWQMRKRAKNDNYTEEECYSYLRKVVRFFEKKGHICTRVYGTEYLPTEGGYVMYPNHQGKYDAYGIVGAHEKPCTVVMDKAKSYDLFIKQVIDMIKGKRMDKEDVRQAFGIIAEMTEEVKQGRRYILFPDGAYDREKKNSLWEFKAGCFKVSQKSRTPIVPVVLLDSYMAWNSSRLGWVTTQVHFLPSIPYEEYQGLNTKQMAELVKARIQEKLDALQSKYCNE